MNESDLKKAKRVRDSGYSSSDQTDRTPPHSMEAERGVLGCIMLDPNQALNECIESFPMGSEVFYDLRHQTIYESMIAMREMSQPIDIITLTQWLRDLQELEQVGGMVALSSFQDAVPSASNIGYYAEIIREKYLLRKMVTTCTNIVSGVYGFSGNVEEYLDSAEKLFLEVGKLKQSGGKKKAARDLVHDAINMLESMKENAGRINGIATGFADFDYLTDGLHPGEMIVIAARPSMGKTSLAMNIAEHVVLDLKLPVGIFSLEMTSEQLMLRTLCSRARVNIRNVKDGFLSERDFQNVTVAAGKLSTAPIHIDDGSGLTVLELKAKARRMAQEYGIKLFIIDYLQLLRTSKTNCDNRQQEIADISNGVKSLAKELGVPIIVLSQLNREIEKEKNRKPRMSDLRESGAIEQDADLVGLLYKPEGDSEGDSESAAIGVNLLIAKQRNGPIGDVRLAFLKQFTRFESASKVSDDDIPMSRNPHAD